jgi:hypothetical protein
MADKLAILLVLHQEAVNVRESIKRTCGVGTQKNFRLRPTLLSLHNKYEACAALYTKAR